MVMNSITSQTKLLKLINNLKYDVVEILGKTALYSDSDFALTGLMLGTGKLHVYKLRGGLNGDPFEPAAVETGVVVANYCGCVLTDGDLGIDPKVGYLPLGEDDYTYTPESFPPEMTIPEFLAREKTDQYDKFIDILKGEKR